MSLNEWVFSLPSAPLLFLLCCYCFVFFFPFFLLRTQYCWVVKLALKSYLCNCRYVCHTWMFFHYSTLSWVPILTVRHFFLPMWPCDQATAITKTSHIFKKYIISSEGNMCCSKELKLSPQHTRATGIGLADVYREVSALHRWCISDLALLLMTSKS